MAAAVDAYRAARGAASAEGAPLKPKSLALKAPMMAAPSYQQPPAQYPTEIPGWPLNWDAARHEIPDYGTMARVQAIKPRQRKLGAQMPMKPIGRSELRKRDSVSRRETQDDRP